TRSYLFRFEGPIADAEALRDFANLPFLPLVLHGTSDDNKIANNGEDDMADNNNTANAQFCLVDGKTRLLILRKLAELQSTFRPTFIRDSKAKKELSPTSLYPTIGIDTTLPQFRLHGSSDAKLVPAQDMYPVWYFFYGTLAEGAVLSRLLCMPANQPPTYRKARLRGGRLTTWARKYKALIDGSQNEIVRGSAYLVNNADDERVLRYYETDKYEVVRCVIKFEEDGKEVRGLTFRFV
ncbi:hypothetical protein CONLIGDRAFT_545902, partial [Coniochaeta ligniaria NRRL 30616]